MAKQFKMTDKLVGVEYVVNAEINNPKLKKTWKGKIKIDLSDVTLDDCLGKFVTKDRTIAFAATVRKDLDTLKGKDMVHYKVSAPGTRTGVTKEPSAADVKKHLAEMDADTLKKLIDIELAKRDSSTDA
jgi:hypothetical protein